jgi:uncharacterized protein
MHRMRRRVVTAVVIMLAASVCTCVAENIDVALITATAAGDTCRVSQLLALGAHAASRDAHGMTALMVAAFKGNLELAKLLIEKGAKVNAKSDSGMTALIGAAAGGHKELVQLLLAKGADPDAKEEHGLTAYEVALTDHKLELAALLRNKTKGAQSIRIRTVVVLSGETTDCLPILSFPDKSSDKVGSVNSGQEVEPTGILTNNEWCMIQKPAVGWVPATSLKDELASTKESRTTDSSGATPQDTSREPRESSGEVQRRSVPEVSEEPSEGETFQGGGGRDWWRRR